MRRHASLDELADLDAGILRQRKAVRVEQHVAICTQCTETTTQLGGVPQLLSSVQYPAMPDVLSMRISVALTAESTTRIAAEPATEAGRRDLPARQSKPGSHSSRRGWQLPGMSVRASRLVTAAGALVILAGGGYAVASGIGSSGGTGTTQSAASSGSAAGLQAGQAVGPRVNYGPAHAERSIQAVTSSQNFVPAKLSTQAADAVRAARLQGVHNGPAASPAAVPGTASAPTANMGTRTALGDTQLGGCIDLVAAGRTILLIEIARFDGQPATIIVAAAEGSRPAFVWAVGDSCSSSNTDILDKGKIAHI